MSASVVHAVGASCVLDPAPTTNVLPPGSSACGPISTTGYRSTGSPFAAVFPANDQDSVRGLKSWVAAGTQVSTVSSWPLGSRVHPSSSLGSSLPVPGITVHPSVFALSNASSTVGFGSLTQVLHGCWSMKVPSGRTSLAASPMFVQPGGGATDVQLPVTGL